MVAAGEVLEVYPFDTVSEFTDPVLWVAVSHHVCGIKIGADPFAVYFINNISHLFWTEQEFIPDVFKSDGDLVCFRGRRKIFQNTDEVIPDLLVCAFDGELAGMQ